MWRKSAAFARAVNVTCDIFIGETARPHVHPSCKEAKGGKRDALFLCSFASPGGKDDGGQVFVQGIEYDTALSKVGAEVAVNICKCEYQIRYDLVD